MRLIVLVFLAGFAAALAATGAGAQSFLGTGPVERLTLPPTGDPLRRDSPTGLPSITAPAAPPAREGSPVPIKSLDPARRLPAGTRGFRLSGEADSLRFPVYLTAGQARAVGSRLRVSYLSAVSVAPETSELSVTVNGVKAGWTRIQAPGAVKVVEFALREGSLQQGYNVIGFAVRQHHRVDCSVDATYELWTQIDPSRTGLAVPPVGLDLTLQTLAALEPDETGALPVRILLAEKPALGRLKRMIDAVQAIALIGRLAHPAVEFGPPIAGRTGLNLIVGTNTEIRTTEGIEALGMIGGPSLVLLPNRPDRAPTLVVTGPTESDLDEAIRRLARTGDDGNARGAQFADLVRGYQVAGGETITLDRLGLTSQEFGGRQLRARFELRFPADFIPADYAKVKLNLAGASAAGLSPEARVIVDVNGQNAASVPLAYSKGELFENYAIPIPLGMWRPGLNRVDIAAQVPTEADRTCEDQGTGRARFLFLDRTRIVIPSLARAVRDPDLAALRAGAVPFVRDSRRARLVLPTPDPESTAAAAMIVARMAMAVSRIIDFELVTDLAAPGGAALVVAPARALDPTMLTAVGLDPEQVRKAWENRAETVPAPGQPVNESLFTLDRLRRDLPVNCALPLPIRSPKLVDAAGRPVETRGPASAGRMREARPTPGAPAIVTASASDEELLARWDRNLRGGTSWLDGLAASWNAFTQWMSGLWAGARSLTTPQSASGPAGFDARASLIMAEGASLGSFESSLTVVSAPNTWMLKASVSCLVDPLVWTNLVGRAVFLNAGDGSVSALMPDSAALFETRDRSIGNLWLISAAWLSLNPALYVALTLSMALCLGLATAALVREIGRRNG